MRGTSRGAIIVRVARVGKLLRTSPPAINDHLATAPNLT